MQIFIRHMYLESTKRGSADRQIHVQLACANVDVGGVCTCGTLLKVEAKTFQTVFWPARALLLK